MQQVAKLYYNLTTTYKTRNELKHFISINRYSSIAPYEELNMDAEVNV